MHTPCVILDAVPTLEVHLFSCAGGSFSRYEHEDKGKHKIADEVYLGPSFTNRPVGLGHDIGAGRIHVLICIELPKSIPSSIIATIGSANAPHFSAHKCLIGVGGAALPICTYPIPIVCMLEGMGCGSPASLNIFRPATALGTLVGMTLGDIIGGIINMWCAGTFNTFDAIIGEYLGKIMPDELAGLITACASAAGFTIFGGSNLGVVFQQMWNEDGINHDAKPELTVLGEKTVMPTYVDDPARWDVAVSTLYNPGMQATPESKDYYRNPDIVKPLTTPGMQDVPEPEDSCWEPEEPDTEDYCSDPEDGDPATVEDELYTPQWWDQ